MVASSFDTALDPQTRRRILTALFVGVFMAALDVAVIAPAVPALRDAFGIDNSQVGMVTIIFSLFTLSSTTLMAALSDRYGHRPVFMLCVTGFALGSLVIAAAPSFAVVLLGRAIQGFSAGGVNPIASAVVGDVFPPAERGKALGLMGATFGMAFILGPLVASLILVVLSWHWIFLLNLPVAVLVLWLANRNLPRTNASGPPVPLDWTGILLVGVMLAALVLGINRVLDKALGLMLWPYLLAFAALCVPLLIRVEGRVTRPVVPLNLFTTRQLALTYILCVGAGFGMGSVVFISSVAVHGLAVDPKQAGLLLLPLVVVSAVGSMGFGRLLNSLGSRRVLLIGFGTLAVGSVMLTFTGPSLGLWIFMPASMLIGLGVGIVVGGTLRTIVLNEVSPEQRATAQGLINVATSVGSLLVVAALSALADAEGGGMRGLSVAYLTAAVLMVVMFLLSLGLKAHGEEVGVPLTTGEASRA